MKIDVKTALQGPTPESASRTGSSNADTSSASFRGSLQHAVSNAETSGQGTSSNGSMEIHSSRRSTDNREAKGRNRQDTLHLQDEASPLDQPMPLETDNSQLSTVVLSSAPSSSMVTTYAIPPDASAEPTQAALVSTDEVSSKRNADDLVLTGANASTLTSVMAQELPLDIPSQVDPSAALKNIPEATQSIADSSNPAPRQPLVDSSQSGSPQTSGPDLFQDSILSAIRAAVFASATPTTAPLVHLSPNTTGTTHAATQSIATSAGPVSFSASTKTPAPTEATTLPVLSLQMPIDGNRFNRSDLASNASVPATRKTVANSSTKPSSKEAENTLATPAKSDTAGPIDEDSSRQTGVAAIESGRDTTSSQQPLLVSTTPIAASLPGSPSLAPLPTPLHGTAGDTGKPQQPELLTSVATPSADSTMALNSVKLMQRMGQAEMTIGMHSPEFGAISIRTSNVRDQVAAEVSLDHAELSKAILSHLPEMQSKLNGDRPLDLRITSPGSAESFSQGSSSGSTSQGGGQRTPQGMASQNFNNSKPAQQIIPAITLAELTRTTSSSSRLDIRV